MDGNQFVLTDSEEKSKKPREIVIYGGGGTTAACYRKGFFGNDIHTENRHFYRKYQRNKVVWIAKQFNKAGTGKLATNALLSAYLREELLNAELLKIQPQSNDKLLLTFNNLSSSSAANQIQMQCDQFVYSIGQDDSRMRAICEEIEPDLTLNFNNGTLLSVSTKDGRVVFFGAAAMTARETAYLKETWEWLEKQNIGGDVGLGSMPPSRAQIKMINFLNGIPLESINANIDSDYLIIHYLASAGVKSSVATDFTAALLVARKQSTSGCNSEMLKELLERYQLDEVVEIYGHGQLVLKASHDHNETQDADLSCRMRKVM